jgi:hypothetical protein
MFFDGWDGTQYYSGFDLKASVRPGNDADYTWTSSYHPAVLQIINNFSSNATWVFDENNNLFHGNSSWISSNYHANSQLTLNSKDDYGFVPLRFTEGSLASTPITGAEEMFNNLRYYTGNNGTRYTYASQEYVSTNYVPYTGATANVDLGSNFLLTPKIYNGTNSTNTLTLQNYSGSTNTFVIDQNGLTAGGGSSVANSLFTNAATYTNPSSIVYGYSSSVNAAMTSGTTTTQIRGFSSTPSIGATNTQNWTNAVMGGIFQPSVTSGATGTIGSLIGIRVGGINNAVGATVTNYFGYQFNGINATGSITNATAFLATSLTQATNNSYIVTGQSTIPTGNWNIYSATGFNNYLGTGATMIGSSTDNGTGAKFQLTGSQTLTGSVVSTGFEASPVGWEFGKLYAPSGLSLNTTNYVSVRIGGITYKLALVN